MRNACLFACSLAAVAACTNLDTSSTEQGNHSWGGYHWARTSNPFTVKVGDNVTSQWDSVLNTTVNDWSQSQVLDTVKVAGAAKGRCRGTTGRVEVCNDTYGNNGWLGLASISITGGTHITKGTVKLNDTYHNQSPYNTLEWRNMVSCQEVGHTLGLDHQDENFDNANLGTCMDYTSNPGTNQHPNSHDYQQLSQIYAHTDSINTTSFANDTDFDTEMDDEDPANWGVLVGSWNNGLTERYVYEHASGDATITVVTWANANFYLGADSATQAP